MIASLEIPPTRQVPSVRLAEMLQDAQARTMQLIEDLTPEQRCGTKEPGLNPLWWELGHIAWFHEKFILRALDRASPLHSHADDFFDSFQVGHDARWKLASSDLSEPVEYLRQVRGALIGRLGEGLADEAESYLYQLTVFHEDMHQEAFVYTRQRLGYPPPAFASAPPVVQKEAGMLEGDVSIPGGAHLLGSDPRHVPFTFDNEREAHWVEFDDFHMARAPVTNEAFAAFVADGGYERRDLWSEEGWQWLCQNGVKGPVYWHLDRESGWRARLFDKMVELRPNEPVTHVSWFEADAYCRWAGRRLPTEIEWEVAATRELDDSGKRLTETKRLYPWGDGHDDRQRAQWDGDPLGVVDVAAYPSGESPLGCRQLLGNVWEWTASPFQPYPGFRPDAYKEYSEPWFRKGDNKVLRGGSWMTRSRMINGNHRNFFTPDRRDIFSGFRTCALT